MQVMKVLQLFEESGRRIDFKQQKVTKPCKVQADTLEKLFILFIYCIYQFVAFFQGEAVQTSLGTHLYVQYYKTVGVLTL